MKTLKLSLLSLLTASLFGHGALAQDLMGLEDRHNFSTLDKEKRVSDSGDPDVVRAVRSGLWRDNTVRYAYLEFRDERRHKWNLQVFENAQNPDGPTFLVLHDNEDSAFQTGAKAIMERGGHLLALHCNESRICDGVDPNRNFDLRNRTYIDVLMHMFREKNQPVITLHNNAHGHVRGKGALKGGGVICSAMPNPYTRATSGYFGKYDSDDLIIFGDVDNPRSSGVYQKWGSLFEDRAINFIFEYDPLSVDLYGDDINMSSFVIKETNFEYFNVEAEHGHTRVQEQLLNQLLDELY